MTLIGDFVGQHKAGIINLARRVEKAEAAERRIFCSGASEDRVGGIACQLTCLRT